MVAGWVWLLADSCLSRGSLGSGAGGGDGASYFVLSFSPLGELPQ